VRVEQLNATVDQADSRVGWFRRMVIFRRELPLTYVAGLGTGPAACRSRGLSFPCAARPAPARLQRARITLRAWSAASDPTPCPPPR
jgi:hypothetical protein